MGSGALSAGPPGPSTPHKKMKKRKELNALIGLSVDNGRKKSKNGNGHRLLRTEPPTSDSYSDTEQDELSLLEDGHSGRRRFRQCCKVCYPLCGLVMLAACVVTCVGLVYMQAVLKENIDVLNEKLRAMEASQKSSKEEIPKINEDLLAKQKSLDDILTGDEGLVKLWTNITEMNKQIAQLTSAVNHLKASLKSASDVINLPNTMEELQKSVASLGSTLTSVHQDVETMKTVTEEQKKKVEMLQKDMATLNLQNSLENMNESVLRYQRQNDLRYETVDTTVSSLMQRVNFIENDLQLVNKKDNTTLSLVDNTTSPGTNGDNPADTSRIDSLQDKDKGESPVSDLQQKLQLIQALTNKPESGKQPAPAESGNDSFTSRTTVARLSPRYLHAEKPGHISLPGIMNEKDLEQLFKESDKGLNGELSYSELENLLGSGLPDSQILKQYDADGNNAYSLTELKAFVDS
ncbi:EF-hand calcium-binding domain-containing protein 14 [Rhinophrynus dorsalis]